MIQHSIVPVSSFHVVQAWYKVFFFISHRVSSLSLKRNSINFQLEKKHWMKLFYNFYGCRIFSYLPSNSNPSGILHNFDCHIIWSNIYKNETFNRVFIERKDWHINTTERVNSQYVHHHCSTIKFFLRTMQFYGSSIPWTEGFRFAFCHHNYSVKITFSLWRITFFHRLLGNF